MASFGQSVTLGYSAYNTSTGAYVTGDVANHTLKLNKDGTVASPTNAASEDDATNAPGQYSVVLTAAEAQHNVVKLMGKSATANVIIIPNTISFEQLPTAVPGAANGVLIAGANAATTFNGTAASGATPATAGLIINGGAASTTGGGVAAPGMQVTGGAGAASTNGAAAGATITAGGTTTVSGADGLDVTGTGAGNGAVIKSGTGATGDGLQVTAASTNGNGLNATGTGTGAGTLSTGGATGSGIKSVGGATSGNGILANGGGTGNGISAQSGTGATGDGLIATANSTNGNGIKGVHAGTGVDLNATTTPLMNVNVQTYNGQVAVTGATSNLPKVDTEALNDNTASVVNLKRSTLAIGTGTVGTGSTLTNIVVGSVTPSMVVAGQFVGRVIIFDENTTTANLRAQGAIITANDASGNITVGASTLTTAPANGDTFTIT